MSSPVYKFFEIWQILEYISKNILKSTLVLTMKHIFQNNLWEGGGKLKTIFKDVQKFNSHQNPKSLYSSWKLKTSCENENSAEMFWTEEKKK